MTSGLEELASRQRQIGAEIQRIISNLGKEPHHRRTRELFTARLKELDRLWDNFEATDNVIRAQFGDQLAHDYFIDGYYDTIRQAYQSTREKIAGNLEQLQEPELPTNTHTKPHIDNEDSGDKVQQYATVSPPDTDHQVNDSILNKPATLVRQSLQNNHISGLIRRQQAAKELLHRTFLGTTDKTADRSREFYHIKIKTIERHWDEILQLHNQIYEQPVDPTLNGYNVQQFFDLEEQTQQKLIELYELSNQVQQQSSIQRNSTDLKLPKIVLPTFKGDYMKWRQFHDIFVELVHKQPIANCQKIFFLKTSLVGDAEKLIRHITPTEANYEAAWKIINDRFENKRLLVTAVLNKLMSQPTASIEGASAIRALHDTTQECLLALHGLGVDTDTWDPILLHTLMKKLDKSTHTLWEQSLKHPRELQTLKDFLEYLETRFQSLEALGSKTKSTDDANKHVQRSLTTVSNTTPYQCKYCKERHQLFACNRFLEMTPAQRFKLVKETSSCINCLRDGHTSSKCSSRGCKICKKKHNTLLHLEESTKPTTTNTFTTTDSSSASVKKQSISLTAQGNYRSQAYVFLSTALVQLSNQHGKTIECKAILDSGSQLNFITEKTMKNLGLTPISHVMHIQGIGRETQQAKKRVNIQLGSRLNAFSIRMEAHVLPKIISNQPSKSFDTSSWAIPNNIPLADPTFYEPGSIDVLIGAELYHSLLSVGQIKLGRSLPTLQNTVFGWTVSGKIKDTNNAGTVCGICSADEALDHQIERFWQLDELPSNGRRLTASEKQCELHFNHTFSRNEEGRFVVRLPFKEEPISLGESADVAFQRFISLERRFAKSIDLKTEYIQFMQEYQQLGHMEEVIHQQLHKPYYFLPHHCVTKADSSTTKLRVVFDGSAKTSSNLSLNDVLATGPSIQDDVFSILIRFRMPRYVFSADIEKMYRQILIHEEDTKYQHIWWRSSPNEPLKCFKLKTVTYGTTSAPYLAIKCLQRLAEDHQDRFPLASRAIKRNFYVDDVMTGSDSLHESLATQEQLQRLLQTAGFRLRKWCANHQVLIQNIPNNDRETELNFDTSIEEHVKTVGMTWLPKSDNFCIKSSWVGKERVTKRTAYSDIAHLFDPLGLMGPIVVTAKIFLQQLWELKYDWDAALPQVMQTTWLKYREGLKGLHNIKIPRYIFSHKIPKNVQFHVFADASEKAYGAVTYVRSKDKNNLITVRLLCSKSRIAPAKKTKISHECTIPRLELCAAKLAAELIHRLQTDLEIKQDKIYLWTDSEIVLNWINTSSSATLPTFIANRVSIIQELTAPQQWRHVSSKENPADVLSRGIAPELLENHTLWFYGPRFLHGAESIWPPKFAKKPEIHEENIALPAVSEPLPDYDILGTLNHRNSFHRAIRIISYMLRVKRPRNKQCDIDKGNNRDASLNSKELDQAWKILIRLMQKVEFKDDIIHLQRHHEVSKNSPLATLTPFLDQEGIIRVGGRLESSALQYDAKHPVLMPYSHPYTKLLLMGIHQENKHAGPQTTLAIARQRYWPIKGKTLARSIIHNYVFCSRSRPKLLSQMMGSLPADRIQPARPFLNTGIDFCGPIWTHYKLRGKRPQKSYISVFCCFATKACHLELVSDLTSQGFIGALKRFMPRRGHCKNIYCDNATNFVGARNQLMELKQFIDSTKEKEQITAICTAKGCDFSFIPPRSPHFGGLWEAAVKSAKHLLQHVLASASLTYEELETAVVEVEAILNSRPITPMSSSPNDLTALTPGHFLIGEPMTSNIDQSAKPESSALLTRWKLVSSVKNEFWRRWSSEYLSQLQHRYKWKEKCQNVEPGLMVIVKEDNQPSLKWPLGRIINTVKGPDGLVRVADVHTASGVFRRAIHRLAPLPIHQSSQADPGIGNCSKQHNNDEDQIANSSANKSKGKRLLDSPPPNKRKKTLSLGTALVALLLACVYMPMSTANEVEVNKFESHPGIHFEGQGTIKLIQNTWNLVVYYNLEPYRREFETLKNSTKILDHLCQQISSKSLCTQVVQQFQFINQELTEENLLLRTTRTSRKVRRGALDIVGNVANSLFGVLDSRYAEEMDRNIEKIYSNEDYLKMLLENNTSLLDSTVNIMKLTEADSLRRHNSLVIQLEQITNRINNFTNEMYQIKVQQLFSSWSIYTTLIVANLQRSQASILDVLSDTHHGRIHHLLISPQQLKQELIKIKNHLPLQLRLPVEPENMLQLYKLMSTEGRITANYVIFKVKLPLISLDEFLIFKLIPIPAVVNNVLIAIDPSSTLLAVSAHHDQYYPMSEDELSICNHIEDTHHLCTQSHPIYRPGANISMCELNFLNNISSLSTCKLKTIKTTSVWTQIPKTNQWIYAVIKGTRLNIVCNHRSSLITIEGSGILKLKPNCIVKHDHITIQAHRVYSNNMRVAYTRLSRDIDLTNVDHTVALQYSAPIISTYQAELQEIRKQISSQQSELPYQIQQHNIRHTALSSSGLLLAIGLIVFLIWKSRRCIRRRTEYPIPSPRGLQQPSQQSSINRTIEHSSMGGKMLSTVSIHSAPASNCQLPDIESDHPLA